MEKRDIAREAIRLAQGDKLPDATNIRLGYRRISLVWLREVGETIRSLEFELRETRAALRRLVWDWESVPETAQVPDEINVDEHWARAKELLAD
jgi:hypothetical protein